MQFDIDINNYNEERLEVLSGLLKHKYDYISRIETKILNYRMELNKLHKNINIHNEKGYDIYLSKIWEYEMEIDIETSKKNIIKKEIEVLEKQIEEN